LSIPEVEVVVVRGVMMELVAEEEFVSSAEEDDNAE